MLMTKHRLASQAFANAAFERFEGTFVGSLQINTGVNCGCVSVRTTDDQALVATHGDCRMKLRPGSLFSARGVTVFFDRVDHAGHIVLTITTESTAHREEW